MTRRLSILWPIFLTAAFPLAAQSPRPETIPAELAWVPPDSLAFVHIKFAALWGSAISRDVRKSLDGVEKDLLAHFEKKLGLSPSEIESVTLVLPELILDPNNEVVVRATTKAPFNKSKLLLALSATLWPEDEAKKAASPSFFSIAGRRVLHLSSERSITILPPDDKGGMALLSKLLSRRREGPLSPALQMASGPHQVVAAIDLTQMPKRSFEKWPELRALHDAKFAMLTGQMTTKDADAKIQFEVQLTFGRPGQAESGAATLDDVRKLLTSQLKQSLEELSRDEKEYQFQIVFLKEAIRTLEAAKIESRGAAVAVTAQMTISQAMTKLAASGADSLKFTSARDESQFHLKQIALGMHNYHDVHGMLPPAAICDKNGKPLLSWRVAILPYIEQDDLYRKFKLDEPWDSEHNIKLIAQMPNTYRLPRETKQHAHPSTHYQVLVGNDAMFELKRGVKFAQVPDGLSNTIIAVEAAEAVPWTKPDDLAYDPKQAPNLGYYFRNRCNVVMGDGFVRQLDKNLKPEILHLLIQRSDGKPISNLP